MRNDDQFDPEAEGAAPHELEALHALPREMDPGQLLEERTVQALRQRGLLRAAPRRAVRSGWGWAVAAVLALVLFSAGFALGRSGSRTGAVNPGSVAHDSRPTRESGVAREQKPAARDVTVATGIPQPASASSERYVVWF